MYGPYFGHEWMFDGGMGLFFAILWMIAIWGIPLLVLVALLKYLFSKPRGEGERLAPPPEKTPLDIVKEAYARGEISRDEYFQKREDLLKK